jgi:hypothetical protein
MTTSSTGREKGFQETYGCRENCNKEATDTAEAKTKAVEFEIYKESFIWSRY